MGTNCSFSARAGDASKASETASATAPINPDANLNTLIVASFVWASPLPGAGPTLRRCVATKRLPLPMSVRGALLPVLRLMRERPEPDLLLDDLPHAGEAARLVNQQENEETAEDDALELGQQVAIDLAAEQRRDIVQREGQQLDVDDAEERAQDTAEATHDDHEQHLEGARQAECLHVHRAEIEESPERARDPQIERADPESEQLGLQNRNTDDLGGHA